MKMKLKSIKLLPSSVEAMITKDVIDHVKPKSGETSDSLSKEEEDHIIRQLETVDHIREIPDDYSLDYKQ